MKLVVQKAPLLAQTLQWEQMASNAGVHQLGQGTRLLGDILDITYVALVTAILMHLIHLIGQLQQAQVSAMDKFQNTGNCGMFWCSP